MAKKKVKGWLDKFDEKELQLGGNVYPTNYIPQAQNGLEGSTDGFTDQGFNYNGAWGGTMQMGGNIPGSVGFTYARTKGIPSKGPHRNQTDVTDASAQNGAEMKFYQEGLDWTPRNISRDGSQVPKAQAGWQERLAQEAAKLDNPLSALQLTKKGWSKDDVKTIQNAANKQKSTVATPKGKQLSKEEIFARNKQYAQEAGKTFNPESGSVSNFLSPGRARNLERGSESIMNAADYAMNVPGRILQSQYKQGYGLEDALMNRPSGASMLEEGLADPTNIGSLGLKGLGKGALKALSKLGVKGLAKGTAKGAASAALLPFYKSIEKDPAVMEAFRKKVMQVQDMATSKEAREAFQRVGDFVTRGNNLVDIDPMYAQAITDPNLPSRAIDHLAKSLTSIDPADNMLNDEQLKYLNNVGSLAIDWDRIGPSPSHMDKMDFVIENSKGISPRDIMPYLYKGGWSGIPDSKKADWERKIYEAYEGQGMKNPLAEHTASADLLALADTYNKSKTRPLGHRIGEGINSIFQVGEQARPQVMIDRPYFDNIRGDNQYTQEAIHLLQRGPKNPVTGRFEFYPKIPDATERIKWARQAGKQTLEDVKRTMEDRSNLGRVITGAQSLSTDSYPLTLKMFGRDKDKFDFVPIHTGSASKIFPTFNTMSGLSMHNSGRNMHLSELKPQLNDQFNFVGGTPAGSKNQGTKELQAQFLESGLMNSAIHDFNKTVGTNMPSSYYSADKYGIARPNVGVVMKKDGGPVRDDNGYWNPENWGKPVEIGSNNITMRGVNQPLIGISDEGDVQYMQPEQDYKFKGKKVTEYPVAQDGVKTSANPRDDNWRKEKAKQILAETKRRIAENDWLDVPEDLKAIAEKRGESANACIGGVCDVYKSVGALPETNWSNTSFAKKAKDYGFENNGWGIKGLHNLESGDILQYVNDVNEQGNYYPGHSQIFMGVGEDGQYEFFDNFAKSVRRYPKEEVQKLLDPVRKKNENQASIYKINPYHPTSSGPYNAEADKALRDRQAMIDWETERTKGYDYSINEDSKYAKKPPKGMTKFIEFANDDDKVNDLVRKLGVDKATVHDELLNTFGELGQENKWEDPVVGGNLTPSWMSWSGVKIPFENTVEKIFKPKGASIGPGQIKFNTIDPELKKKFNIKKPKDLYDFDKVIPLMTAMNIQNRKFMENQGTNLSEKLIGQPGVGAGELKGGVGRWTPYMYRGRLNNPVSAVDDEMAGTDLYGQDLTNERNSLMRDKAALLDEGSYPMKVFNNIDQNLKRTMFDNYFENYQDMQPIVITGKKKKKNGGSAR